MDYSAFHQLWNSVQQEWGGGLACRSRGEPEEHRGAVGSRASVPAVPWTHRVPVGTQSHCGPPVCTESLVQLRRAREPKIARCSWKCIELSPHISATGERPRGMGKAQRDGEHSCLWLVMRSPRSRWPGEPTLTQKPLCTCCWSEGIPGWEPPLLGEHYCSQTNINQARSPAQCPTVPEKGAYRERPFSVQGTAQPGRHAGSHWAMVWGPRSCLFKGLVKELALPSGLFMG